MIYRHVTQGGGAEVLNAHPEVDAVLYLISDGFGISLKSLDRHGRVDHILSIKKNGFLFRHPDIVSPMFSVDSNVNNKIRASVQNYVN